MNNNEIQSHQGPTSSIGMEIDHLIELRTHKMRRLREELVHINHQIKQLEMAKEVLKNIGRY